MSEVDSRREKAEQMIAYFDNVKIPEGCEFIPGHKINDGKKFVQRNADGLREGHPGLRTWRLCYMRLYTLKTYLEGNKEL